MKGNSNFCLDEVYMRCCHLRNIEFISALYICVCVYNINIKTNKMRKVIKKTCVKKLLRWSNPSQFCSLNIEYAKDKAGVLCASAGMLRYVRIVLVR
jgi:hypothetical protein